MDKQSKKLSQRVPVSTPTKPETEKSTTAKKNQINLGKRKKSEPPEGNTNEARKKIQKVAHSNTIDGELVEKKKSEIILDPSFAQTKIACACGLSHTITLSNDGTVYSFGRNNKGQLGFEGHKQELSLPTPIPNLPKIKMVSCGARFTVFGHLVKMIMAN